MIKLTSKMIAMKQIPNSGNIEIFSFAFTYCIESCLEVKQLMICHTGNTNGRTICYYIRKEL
jgi:hypothetical protein